MLKALIVVVMLAAVVGLGGCHAGGDARLMHGGELIGAGADVGVGGGHP